MSLNKLYCLFRILFLVYSSCMTFQIQRKSRNIVDQKKKKKNGREKSKGGNSLFVLKYFRVVNLMLKR